MNKTGKFNVLVVDDDMDLLDLLEETLQSEHRNVYTASSGREAVEKYLDADFMKKVPVDAVLSDMKMPDFSGLEFMLAHKAMNPSTAFIFLSGYTDRLKLLLSMKYGAHDFLEKPFNSKELEGVIYDAELLGRKRRLSRLYVPQFFKTVGFSDSEILVATRRLRSIWDIKEDRIVEVIMNEIQGELVHKTEEIRYNFFKSYFTQEVRDTLSIMSGFAEHVDNPEEYSKVLRNIYINCVAIKIAANSLGSLPLESCFDVYASTILSLRSSPENNSRQTMGVVLEGIVGFAEHFKKGDVFSKDSLEYFSKETIRWKNYSRVIAQQVIEGATRLSMEKSTGFTS